MKIIDSKNNTFEDGQPTINHGNMLVNHIAQVASNNLDTQKFFIDEKDEDVWGDEEVQNVFKRSRWKILKKNIGKNLSLQGEVAVVVEILQKKVYIDTIKINNYEMLGSILYFFEGFTGKIVQAENKKWEHEIIRYTINKEGKVEHLFGHYELNEKQKKYEFVADTKPNVTTWTIIPVVLFRNNADKTSDVLNGNCGGLVQTINSISNKLILEVRDAKTFTAVNQNFAQSLTEPKFRTAQAKGFLPITDPDSMLSNVIFPIQFSNVQIQQNLLTIDKLQDDLLKLTFTFRDTYNTGTNKHNAEVAISNQAAIEYLNFKREIREQDWSSLFQVLLMVLKKKYKNVTPKVKIKLSEMTENQIKATNAAIVAEAQAKGNIEAAEIIARAKAKEGKDVKNT